MEITGRVHCFFEQSGTFKNEFIKLGIPSEDYDIQNVYGQTDHQIDLFGEIRQGWDGDVSIFDGITPDDLIMAFFPCIYFEALQQTFFTLSALGTKGWTFGPGCATWKRRSTSSRAMRSRRRRRTAMIITSG